MKQGPYIFRDPLLATIFSVGVVALCALFYVVYFTDLGQPPPPPPQWGKPTRPSRIHIEDALRWDPKSGEPPTNLGDEADVANWDDSE